jgi:hypothetical protein
MHEKWTNRAIGAGVGAIAMLVALPLGAGWYTANGAKALAYDEVTKVLMPLCVEAVLANPAAVAELKVKRLFDYDDVVRDHLKTIGTYKTDLKFWRACGKLLEGKVERTATP